MTAPFAIVPLALFGNPQLADREAYVLIALYSFADSSGACWPSLASIAQRSYTGRSTVARVLQSLEAKGFLTRERRQKAGTNAPTSTLYHLTSVIVPQRDSLAAGLSISETIPDQDGDSPAAGPEHIQLTNHENTSAAFAPPALGSPKDESSPEMIVGLSTEGLARLETIKAENRERIRREVADMSEEDVRAAEDRIVEYSENRIALRQLLAESPSLDAPSPSAAEGPRARRSGVGQCELLVTDSIPAPEVAAGKKPCRSSPPQPMTHQILELFSDVAKIEGVTIAYRGKDGAAAKRLAVLFQDKPEDLEDLCAFFFGIRKKRDDRFWNEQPPTPSAFLALLSRVQTLYAKERPREEDAEVCPACGGPVKASASLCPHCGLSKGSFSDAAAIEAARRRAVPLHTAEVPA